MAYWGYYPKNRSMKLKLHQAAKAMFLAATVVLWSAGLAYAGTATGMSGFYYSGVNSSGGLLAGGSQDPNWSVTYASINGGTSANTTYEGAAYVINPGIIAGQNYVQNTTTSQWITAPAASSAQTGGTLNTGGDYLPGNGNTGANEGVYIYRLAFQITGTGSGTITNNVRISVTIAADDQYSIYVNPTGSGTSIPTGTPAGSRTSAWTNTAAINLANYTYNGNAANAQFVIGTNYLVVVVDNTNSITGASGSTALNPSGMLVYQVSNVIVIDGVSVPGTIPEVGVWLPVLGALGLVGWRRRRGRPCAAAVS